MGIPEPRPISREDWARYVTDNWHELRLRFADVVIDHLCFTLTPQMVCEKILAGSKFGPLDLGGIDFPQELLSELVDGIAYLAGGDLQDGGR